MKKSLSLTLALLMLLAVLPISALAANAAGIADIKAVGDTITFGGYYGKPIVWKVHAIDTAAHKALLIPEEMVGYWPFNNTRTEVTWETSTLRTWLNSVFLSNAFSDSEQAVILDTVIDNKANSEYGTGGGANTTDKVFLLSEAEAMQYFAGDAARVAKVNFTGAQIEALAKAIAANTASDMNITYDYAVQELTSYNGTTDWWYLRTSGGDLARASAVSYSGELYKIGNEVNEVFGGLRPAMWVSIKADTKPEPISSGWAKPELEQAAQLGLIPDSLQNADLTKPITRAEFAAVAVKTYEALSGTTALPAVTNPFTDTADVEVLKAYNANLMVGTSSTEFSPDRLLNREEAATALTRVFKRATMPGWTLATDAAFTLLYDKPAPFADDASIATWAKDSVYFMFANGIINGMGNNIFAPKATTDAEKAQGYATATREMAIIIAKRMVEKLG